MNTNIKEIDLSYWGGFIDGEGSVKLYNHPKKNSIGKMGWASFNKILKHHNITNKLDFVNKYMPLAKENRGFLNAIGNT